jgi:hypothetical protein
MDLWNPGYVIIHSVPQFSHLCKGNNKYMCCEDWMGSSMLRKMWVTTVCFLFVSLPPSWILFEGLLMLLTSWNLRVKKLALRMIMLLILQIFQRGDILFSLEPSWNHLFHFINVHFQNLFPKCFHPRSVGIFKNKDVLMSESLFQKNTSHCLYDLFLVGFCYFASKISCLVAFESVKVYISQLSITVTKYLS